MNKKQIIVAWLIMLCLYSLDAIAANFDDTLGRTKKLGPVWGDHHKNIRWIEHIPADGTEEYDAYWGQTDVGSVDLDGDKKEEIIKVIWGAGVSDHSLRIELYKDDLKFDTLKPVWGIQPNFKLEDLDGDGRLEIIVWGGLWDPRLPGEDGVTSETYEGHSARHRYIVATFKLIREEYTLWDIYTTKEKYEPFCKEQPR